MARAKAKIGYVRAAGAHRGRQLLALAARMCAGIPDRTARNRCVAQKIRELKAGGY